MHGFIFTFLYKLYRFIHSQPLGRAGGVCNQLVFNPLEEGKALSQGTCLLHVWAVFERDEETDYVRVQAWSVTIYLIFCLCAP